MFNSLKYAKKLEEVGFSREQAEMHIQIMSEVMESNLATREDLKDFSQEIKDLRVEINRESNDVRQEIKLAEQRMTIKLGSIVSIAVGVAVTLVKLIG